MDTRNFTVTSNPGWLPPGAPPDLSSNNSNYRLQRTSQPRPWGKIENVRSNADPYSKMVFSRNAEASSEQFYEQGYPQQQNFQQTSSPQVMNEIRAAIDPISENEQRKRFEERRTKAQQDFKPQTFRDPFDAPTSNIRREIQ